jgi:hypothetical protein
MGTAGIKPGETTMMTIIDDSMDYWLIALWLYAIVTSVLIIRFEEHSKINLKNKIKSRY